MRTVGFTEFRRHASGLLSEVQNGQVLIVIRHGKPIAEIGPVSADEGREPSWKRPGLRLSAKGAGLAAAILEERARADIP